MADFSAEDLDAVDPVAGTVRVGEMGGGGGGRVTAFYINFVVEDLPPLMTAIYLKGFFGPGGVTFNFQPDSDGFLSADATIVMHENGRNFQVIGAGGGILTNGFYGAACHAEVNYEGARYSVFIQTSEQVPSDFDGGGAPPDAPEDLAATDAGDHVALTWTDTTPDELGFFVERSIGDESNYETIATMPPDSVSFNDYDADPSTNLYFYRLRAFKADALGEYSDADSIGTAVCGDGHTLPWDISIAPTTGTKLGGTTVTINEVITDAINPATGDEYELGVTLGGVQLTPTVLGPTTISVVTEAHAPGAVDVVVYRTETGDDVRLTDAFTYVDDVPTITSLSVTSGSSAGGTTVRIHGYGFLPDSTVLFGGVPATSSTYVSSIRYDAVTPPGIVGTVDVTIVAP